VDQPRDIKCRQADDDRVRRQAYADVFVHYVDLDVGYHPADWPAIFVSTELPKRLRDLPDRTEPAVLLAWLFGRAPSPELGPW